MYNVGYFHGYGKKFLIRIIGYFFSHLYISSVSNKGISLTYNILWVGYLSFRLKSIYERQGLKLKINHKKKKQSAEMI